MISAASVVFIALSCLHQVMVPTIQLKVFQLAQDIIAAVIKNDHYHLVSLIIMVWMNLLLQFPELVYLKCTTAKFKLSISQPINSLRLSSQLCRNVTPSIDSLNPCGCFGDFLLVIANTRELIILKDITTFENDL